MGFDTQLKNLKDTLFGASVVSVDDAIEQVTKEIITKQKFKTTTIVELLRNLTKLEGKEETDQPGTSFVEMLKKGVSRKKFAPETDRSERYRQIDYIYDNNPQVAQALKVFVDNCLSPDVFTKNTLDVICTLLQSEDTSEFEQAKRYMLSIQKHYKMEEHVTEITALFLKYGDVFVEVINPKEELMYYGVLQEKAASADDHVRHYSLAGPPLHEFTQSSTTLLEQNMPKITGGDVLMEADTSERSAGEGTGKKDTSGLNTDGKEKDVKKSKWELNDLRIKVHNPNNVIVLQEQGIILGYLVLEAKDTGASFAGGGMSGGVSETGAVIDEIVRNILQKAGDLLQRPGLKNDSEAINILYNLLKREKLKLGEMVTRLVMPNRLQHFKLLPSKFDPYGESIFYPVLFTAKLLTTLRGALVIYRLSRAPERRVFNIETGLSRDAAAIIEQVKNEMDRREVTIDDLGSIDTISSMTSTFESIYLPMTNGKKFIELETMQGGQLADKVEDINFVLKEVLSGLGIPPALLGYEADIESKSTLSQQNIKFARSIIQIQKLLSQYFTNLYLMTVEITEPEMINLVTMTTAVALKPPRSLMLAGLTEMAEELDKLVDTFKKLEYPVERIISYYFGDIMEPEILEQYRVQARAEKQILAAGDEEDEGGEGGGF